MATLTPVSRDAMRKLKAKTDEKKRLMHVEQYISSMYNQAVRAAKTSTETKWNYATDHRGEFIVTNIDDILSGLRYLFPNCSVEFKSVTTSRGHDGKMHDVSKLDPKALSFLGTVVKNQCIVIDWS